MDSSLASPRIRCGENIETVFLLSGDDLKVHLYRQVLISGEVRDE